LRVVVGKSEQLGAALRRDDSGKEKKMEEFFPGEIGGGKELVDEVDGEATADKARSG